MHAQTKNSATTSTIAESSSSSTDLTTLPPPEEGAWSVHYAGKGAEASRARVGKMAAGKTMLVLGATSDIARATIFELIADGWSFFLAGRDLQALQLLAEEVAARSGRVVAYAYFDAVKLSIAEMELFWDSVTSSTRAEPVAEATPVLPPLLGLLCAVGMLCEQKQAESDWALLQTMMQANLTGLVTVLSLAANYFEAQHKGQIVVISSVAGERGRCSNYVYGAAKAGMTAFVSGMRARLSASNVEVLTVLPGWVQTKMVAGRELIPALTARPEQVAVDIVRAMHRGQDVVYTRWWWRYIMWVVKLIPERFFKRMRKY